MVTPIEYWGHLRWCEDKYYWNPGVIKGELCHLLFHLSDTALTFAGIFLLHWYSLASDEQHNAGLFLSFPSPFRLVTFQGKRRRF